MLQSTLLLLDSNKNIAFLEGFVQDYGFWALTLCCLVPMFAFVGYVLWYDARQAKAHHHNH